MKRFFPSTNINFFKKLTSGYAGLDGTYGRDGDKGLKGSKGEKSDITLKCYGVKGEQGQLYYHKPNSTTVIKGEKGRKGDKGMEGEPGNHGRTGAPGPSGLRGPKGYKGAEGELGDRGKPGKEKPLHEYRRLCHSGFTL